MRHVVWDWNGTLFDDLHIVVDAVNAALAAIGAPQIDADGYRTHYGRPVRRFYERLLARPLADREWATLAGVFHVAYRDSLDRAGLAIDARVALETAAAAGASQSLLSMWSHEELVPFVTKLGLHAYLVRMDGSRRDADDTKEQHLRAHLAALGVAPGHALVVGDALDDARAAAAVGAPCVLYDGGSHHRRELQAAGVPVAGSLLEAVRLGGGAAARP